MITTNPAPHQEIAPDQPIQLTFDQPMDRASVQKALSIAPNLSAQFGWRDDQTLTLTFATPPTRGQTYTLILGADAKSAAGSRVRRCVPAALRCRREFARYTGDPRR